MVGKPNFPEDAEKRKDLRGAAITTQGLDALDQEREASMADEGGASGALMENEDEVDPILLEAMHQSSQPQAPRWALVAGVGAIAGVGALIYYFSSKKNGSRAA